jgi:ankyrin repeat protein
MGAAVNARDDSGRTALDTAIDRDEPDKIELLLAYGGKKGTDA